MAEVQKGFLDRALPNLWMPLVQILPTLLLVAEDALAVQPLNRIECTS